MVMIFAAFTSAYVVKKGDVNVWQDIQLPQVFTVSTVVIAISSITMHLAWISFQRNKIYWYRGLMVTTFLLGASFLSLQIQGWTELVQSGIRLNGNVAGSFIYVISGAHFVHVAGGVIALLVFAIQAFTKIKSPVEAVMVNLQPGKIVKVEVMMTYWHFVDILWVYLFFFFILNR
jgi:cytochrome c oxidase subunit 3